MPPLQVVVPLLPRLIVSAVCTERGKKRKLLTPKKIVSASNFAPGFRPCIAWQHMLPFPSEGPQLVKAVAAGGGAGKAAAAAGRLHANGTRKWPAMYKQVVFAYPAVTLWARLRAGTEGRRRRRRFLPGGCERPQCGGQRLQVGKWIALLCDIKLFSSPRLPNSCLYSSSTSGSGLVLANTGATVFRMRFLMWVAAILSMLACDCCCCC